MRLFLFYILTFILFCATIFPFWNIGWWWVRFFDFPRLQIFFLNLILIAALISGSVLKFGSINSWILLAGFILSLGLDIFRIYPYAISRKKESATYKNEKAIGKLSILTCNILLTNKEHSKIFNLIEEKDPDLVLLLETDKIWVSASKVLEKKYPHHILLPQENGYGKVFFSKFPLKNTRIEHLVDKTVPSIFTDIIINDEAQVHFIGLHPRPPRPNEGPSDQRDSELMLVAEYIKNRKDQTILVAGDLNDVAWSHTTRLFRRISGTLDPRVGRGMFNTFHANSMLFRFPLDHFFHSKQMMISEILRLEHVGSDHFPLWAKFHILAKPSKKHKPEDKQSSDHQEMKDLQDRGKDLVSPDSHKDEPLDP